jgi:hypothetical protein
VQGAFWLYVKIVIWLTSLTKSIAAMTEFHTTMGHIIVIHIYKFQNSTRHALQRVNHDHSVAILARAKSMMSFADWDAYTSEEEDGVVARAGVVAAAPACDAPDGGALVIAHPPDTHARACDIGVLSASALQLALVPLHRKHVVPAPNTDLPLVLVPGVGGEIVRLAAAAIPHGSHRSSAFEQELSLFCAHGAGLGVVSRQVQAALTGLASKTHSAEKMQAIAAAEHFGSQAFSSSVLLHIQSSVLRKSCKLSATLRFVCSDSTSLPIGRTVYGSVPQLVEHDAKALQSVLALEAVDVGCNVLEDTPTAKIHQSHLKIAALLERPGEKLVALVLPRVCPLQVTDTGQAQTVLAAWDQTTHCGEVDALRAFGGPPMITSAWIETRATSKLLESGKR